MSASAASGSMLPKIFLDYTKEKNNVLVVMERDIHFCTLPASELHRFEKNMCENPSGELASTRCAAVPFTGLTHLEIAGAGLTIGYRSGIEQRCEAFAMIEQCDELARDFAERTGGNWEETVRYGRAWKAAFTMLGCALLFAAITAFFYLGIQHGFIQRGPAWLAMIVNAVGLTGLLAIGTVVTLSTLGFGIYLMLVPVKTTLLQRIDR